RAVGRVHRREGVVRAVVEVRVVRQLGVGDRGLGVQEALVARLAAHAPERDGEALAVEARDRHQDGIGLHGPNLPRLRGASRRGTSRRRVRPAPGVVSGPWYGSSASTTWSSPSPTWTRRSPSTWTCSACATSSSATGTPCTSATASSTSTPR